MIYPSPNPRPLQSCTNITFAIIRMRAVKCNVIIFACVVDAISAYEWLVCYLLRESNNKLKEELRQGKDGFTARNDSQVYYCRTLSIAFIEVSYWSYCSALHWCNASCTPTCADLYFYGHTRTKLGCSTQLMHARYWVVLACTHGVNRSEKYSETQIACMSQKSISAHPSSTRPLVWMRHKGHGGRKGWPLLSQPFFKFASNLH